MSSEKKMWFLRVIEKILVIIILLLVSAGVWWLIFQGEGDSQILQWGVVSLGVLLLILLIIQNIVDKYFSQALAYANQSDDEKFRSLYESSPTALVTIDPDGRILHFNPASVKLLNTTMDGLHGRNFFDFVLSHTGHDTSMLKGKIHSGVTLVDEEISIKTLTDQEIWALMSVYEDKQLRHHIVSLIDMTQAKKVDTAKSEFVALATHQLGTPIAAIRWHLDLLKRKLRDSATEDQQRHLSKIERNVLRMIALIDDFLSVSKLEMGTFAAESESINMSEFFTSILDEFDEKITNKNIKVNRIEKPPEFVYTSDSRLFHIIVSNLVSNAVKYLKNDGELTLAYEIRGDKFVIQVADNGIGIPADEQENLFKRFFRASNALLYQTEGTGLGLYVAQKSAEQLGGMIEVESVENVQTIFSVSLPVKRG